MDNTFAAVIIIGEDVNIIFQGTESKVDEFIRTNPELGYPAKMSFEELKTICG